MNDQVFLKLIANLQKDFRPDFTKYVSDFFFEGAHYYFEFIVPDMEEIEMHWHEHINVTLNSAQYLSDEQGTIMAHIVYLSRQ